MNARRVTIVSTPILTNKCPFIGPFPATYKANVLVLYQKPLIRADKHDEGHSYIVYLFPNLPMQNVSTGSQQ